MKYLIVKLQGGPIEMLRFKNWLGDQEQKRLGSLCLRAERIPNCKNDTVDVSISFEFLSDRCSAAAVLLALSSLSRNGGA